MAYEQKNMTPTLAGRIETRIAVSFAFALPVLIFAGMGSIFFIMLAVGILLDFLYNFLQYRRWDGDWPLVLSLISGLAEGVLLWFLVGLQIPVYGLILILTLIAQVTLGILFPYRRFKGGRIL